MSNTNGHHPAVPPISFSDPAVVARMVAIAVIEGDRRALTDIAERTDLDPHQLELVGEIAVAVHDAITKQETL